MSTNLGEFELIQRYFGLQQSHDPLVIHGIGDDCAVLNVPTGSQLAVSSDTLVEGTHFFAGIDPKDLAIKSLAVNLSDLAACGAIPKWITLALTLPQTDQEWLNAFSQSLFQQLRQYGVTLIGGDTTRGKLSITITAFGLVPVQQTITRRGATAGDYLYVSGFLGDSAAGYAICANSAKSTPTACYSETEQYLLQRHLNPEPRVMHGLALRDYASAMLDLSDGLAGDIQHILTASHCGATIELNQLPLSLPLLNRVGLTQARLLALTGGEDYELCFTIPEAKRVRFEAEFQQRGLSFYLIGRMTDDAAQLSFTDKAQPVNFEAVGFNHFS